jgi:hypothetical protein
MTGKKKYGSVTPYLKFSNNITGICRIENHSDISLRNIKDLPYEIAPIYLKFFTTVELIANFIL